jgi:2-oxoglutarate ferredoxin oxidoreductase subunit gamma
MNEQIIIAGFGGQGVLSMGKMLAEAAMEEGREVSWLPSYGPEMRGGTSNVSVILSDTPIGAPIISSGMASCVIAMNFPSLEKFEKHLKKDGLLLINSSVIDAKAGRKDVKAVYIPANAIAEELGNDKVMNMVMLGAYLQLSKAVDPKTLISQLMAVFGEKKAHLVDLNRQAIEKGAELAKAG